MILPASILKFFHPSLLIISSFFLITTFIDKNLSSSSSLLSPQTDQESNTPKTESSNNLCKISSSFTNEVKYWEKDICRWSEEHQMDPNLIATIMQIESCGNPKAISATGVRGLFQVTGANLDGQDPFDPNVSMAKGPAKVLKNELKITNGNVTAAMAGYNGGGLARQWINGDISTSQFLNQLKRHPSGYWRTNAKAQTKLNEVSWYAKWANIYFESKDGNKHTLDLWLEKGGRHLCTTAATTLGLNPVLEPVISSSRIEKS